jgi:eukaryotic-like serine/threonine-protein kinase
MHVLCVDLPLFYLAFAAFSSWLSSLTNTQDWTIKNMDLWNEYEGRTIDGDFPLTKLLRPEGRSAFFATSNGTGVPTVIRLIESHFDDAEILARWQGITEIDNAHLVKLKKFGQVELDGTSLVYAVMEPVEANLGEILEQRRLTVLETRDVASSLVSALGAMHSHGFVHEHVDAGNVMAVGDAIKLRSDCIREAPEGDEGLEIKRRDVRDLSAVVLQALTQQRTLAGAARELPLPEPFDQIVRKGMSGEWGLREIGAALKLAGPAAAPAATASRVAASAAAGPVVREMPAERPVAAAGMASAPGMGRVRVPVEEEPRGWELKKIAYGVGALLLVLLLVWFFVHGRASSSTGAVQTAAAPAVVAQGDAGAAGNASSAANPGPAASPSTAANAGPAANVPTVQRQAAVGYGRDQWRVVAFTYNRESQAQQKAAAIAQKHSDLRPEVFTPDGRAPYLVTVGGLMSRDEAFALARKARSEGLPRDSYAQNYRGR